MAAPAIAAVSKLVSLFGLSFIAREAGDFLEGWLPVWAAGACGASDNAWTSRLLMTIPGGGMCT